MRMSLGHARGNGAVIESLEGRQLLSGFPFQGWTLPEGTNFPQALTIGGDNNVWFSCGLAPVIGKITPTGTVTTYDTSSLSSHGIKAMTRGPDGNVWFVEYWDKVVGKITPTGEVTTFQLDFPNFGPHSIAFGPDGNFWLTTFDNHVGKLTPQGQVSWFTHSGQGVKEIISFNGALYMQESDTIGRIETSGQFTGEFDLPNDGAIQDIAIGPDGNLWFTQTRAVHDDPDNYVGYLTPSGTIQSFAISKANGDPSGITAGGDGNLYVRQGDYLIALNTSGQVVNSQYLEFIAGGGSVVTSADGNVWYAEGVLDKIGVARVETSPNGLPASTVVVGADAGMSPRVRAYAGQTVLRDFDAYGSGFRGGVRVALADVNGDSTPDIVTGSGRGSCHIKVFDGRDNHLLHSFLAFPGSGSPADPQSPYYTQAFRGGVFVAGGDVDADGKDDIVVGSDRGGPPRVTVFSGATGQSLRSFFAYAQGFLGGVRVASGDVDGDGHADIITGTGSSNPHVRAFSGASGAMLLNYYGFNIGYQQGITVAAGDVDSNGKADVIVGTSVGPPHVKIFRYSGNTAGDLISSFYAFPTGFVGGLRVGSGDMNGDGRDDVVVGSGPGDAGVKVFDLLNPLQPTTLDEFLFDAGFAGGVWAAGWA